MRHVLIVGDGQLGSALKQVYAAKPVQITVWAQPVFDITQPAVAEQVAELAPDVVINAAAWTNVDGAESNPDGTFGILPVPVSDDPADYGNAQVSVGVPAYLVVDAEQSSPEQQAGAVDFLTWLTTSEQGLDFYVNQFKFLPAYDTVAQPPADSLSQQILGYASSGETLEWMNSLYPADGWPTFGAAMQQYVSGAIDRADLADQIAGYWKTVK